jgi:hypothetical protein
MSTDPANEVAALERRRHRRVRTQTSPLHLPFARSDRTALSEGPSGSVVHHRGRDGVLGMRLRACGGAVGAAACRCRRGHRSWSADLRGTRTRPLHAPGAAPLGHGRPVVVERVRHLTHSHDDAIVVAPERRESTTCYSRHTPHSKSVSSTREPPMVRGPLNSPGASTCASATPHWSAADNSHRTTSIPNSRPGFWCRRLARKIGADRHGVC